MGSRTYGQYCGLAKALDRIGDRWTLLIVRELLVGPRRYSDIRAALPGIATNLLADRLDSLAADGIVRRADGGRYELTDRGRELETALHALVRWGGPWMTTRADDEIFRPEWLVVALRALLPKRRPGAVEVHVDGYVLHVDRSRIGVGTVRRPDAVVEGRPEEILGVVAGHLPLSALEVRGDRDVAAAVLSGKPGGRA